MRKIACYVALLITSFWSNVLLAEEQLDTHHPFLYVSVSLAAVSKPNQPVAELGFAIRQSRGLATAYSGSSRQLQLVNLAFNSQGLRNWSAFGIDMTKLSANGDPSAGAEGATGLSPVIIVGGILVGVGLVALTQAVGKEAAKSAADGAVPSFAPRGDISVSTPPPSSSASTFATWR